MMHENIIFGDPESLEAFGEQDFSPDRDEDRDYCDALRESDEEGRSWGYEPWLAVRPSGKRQRAFEAAARKSFVLDADERTRIRKAFDHKCVYCGMNTGFCGEIDHIEPIALGGEHAISNLVLACFRCNRFKRGMSKDRWFKILGEQHVPIILERMRCGWAALGILVH